MCNIACPLADGQPTEAGAAPDPPLANHDIAQAEKALNLFLVGRHELRALNEVLGPRTTTVSRDNIQDVLQWIESLASHVIYWSFNVLQDGQNGASNTTVARRCWLLIDLDPVRPKDTSSTDSEKAKAYGLAIEIITFLTSRGWPEPVIVDSGNGWHLLIRIDLPNDQESRKLCKDVVHKLADMFDTPEVHVDRAVHDAARISKLPGSWTRKGVPTPNRPHRVAGIAYEPQGIVVVTKDQLADLVGPANQPAQAPIPSAKTIVTGTPSANGSGTSPYVAAAIRGEILRVKASGFGHRNNNLNTACFNLAQLAGEPGFDTSAVQSALRQAAYDAKLDQDPQCGPGGIEKTIASGWEAGLLQPRDLSHVGSAGARTNSTRKNTASSPVPTTDADVEWPCEPQSVRPELRPVLPLKAKMIPEPLRGWLVDIAERISCPLEFPTTAALVALGIVLGRKIVIRPKQQDDWEVTCNLWGAIIGRPGVLKTPPLKEAIRPLKRLEVKALEIHKENLKKHQTDLCVNQAMSDAAKADLKAAARATGKDKKSAGQLEALARAVTDIERPVEPIERRYTTSDATVEALEGILANHPCIGVIRDELTGWLRSLEKPDRRTDRAFFLEGWDGFGEAFQSDRVARGHTVIRNALLVVLGSIQPGPLGAFLRTTTKRSEADDGLVSRFQVLLWPDIKGPWTNVDQWPDTEAKNKAYKIFEAFDSLDPAEIGAHDGEDGGPPYLRFTPEAQKRFNEWRHVLENKKLRNPEENPLIESHLGKYRKLMPALALLFHLVDVVGGKARGDVSLAAAEMAIEWCNLMESHARRVYHYAMERNHEAAQALSEKIKARLLRSPFSFRDVYRRCWSCLDDPQSVRQAVAILEELGWVQVVEVTTTGGGPREDIHIHPSLPSKGPKNSNSSNHPTDKTDKTPPSQDPGKPESEGVQNSNSSNHPTDKTDKTAPSTDLSALSVPSEKVSENSNEGPEPGREVFEL
jgi:putative DNA primase/helicase